MNIAMPSELLTGAYDPWLVVLSVIIAIAASHAALEMASRTTATVGALRKMWLGGGAAAMGCGIWSMHYIGMLAFRLPMPVMYDWPTVALSMLAAVFSSAVALFVVSRKLMTTRALITGGIVMGGGISSMHFVGMAAMHVSADSSWNGWVVAGSLLIAVTVSMVALYLAFQLRTDRRAFSGRKLASAAVMGIAIAAMHYCGMDAVSFYTAPTAEIFTHSVNVSTLGVAGIVIVTFLILSLSLVASILDRRFTSQNEALLTSATRHRNQVERSLAGVFWSLKNGRITDCNDACARILGYGSKALLLENTTQQICSAETNNFLTELQSREHITDYECWLERKDATPVCVLTNANLLTLEDGSQLIEGTMIDITARKLIEDELRASEQQLRSEIVERQRMEVALHLNQRLEAVGQLAAGIAHEINTPVQFVSDSVHFLRDALTDYGAVIASHWELQRSVLAGEPSLEIAQAAAEVVRKLDLEYLLENAPLAADRSLEGLERIATIVRSMKAFAHPDQLEMSHIDLNRAVMTTLDVARSEVKYVADVRTDFGDLHPVWCYAGEINQVLLNLVVNAAHAIAEVTQGSDARGCITITTRDTNEETVLTVSDTGCGIPEEIRGRIFDPFFTTKEVGRGTGQGLAIVRTIIVEKHGGQIEVTSELGKGSAFVIRLPHHIELAMAA